jgi:Uma2 family endonuclease
MKVLRKPPAPAPMTVAEFLAWDNHDRSGRLWQLCHGVPQAMAPASDAHGAIQAELGALIRNHLVAMGRPCRVITNPGVTPRVRARDNFRIPDIGVFCAKPSAEPAVSEAVLLIEILSPSNEDETWANVLAYTTIPSVTEILVISSMGVAAEVLRRGADGHWLEEPERLGDDAALELRSIAMTLPLSAAYRTAELG